MWYCCYWLYLLVAVAFGRFFTLCVCVCECLFGCVRVCTRCTAASMYLSSVDCYYSVSFVSIPSSSYVCQSLFLCTLHWWLSVCIVASYVCVCVCVCVCTKLSIHTARMLLLLFNFVLCFSLSPHRNLALVSL